MRPFSAILVCTAALGIAAGGASAPTPAIATRSCAQVDSAYFNVQIAGNRDAAYSLRVVQGDVFAAIPKRKTMVAIWTYGSQSAQGPTLYGWTTSSRRHFSAQCSAPAAPRRPPRGTLRPRFRVEDGWAYTRRFECEQRGRFLIRVDEVRDGQRLSVWMERTRELIAVAEITRRSGWIRASKRCAESRY